MVQCQVTHYAGFYLHFLDILLQFYFVARFQFSMVIYIIAFKEMFSFLCYHCIQSKSEYISTPGMPYLLYLGR